VPHKVTPFGEREMGYITPIQSTVLGPGGAGGS